MATTDELLEQLIMSLVAEGCTPGDFEAECIRVIGKLRTARNRAIREMEAAQLLHTGADNIAARQRCHRSTVYRRAQRGRLSRYMQHDATKS